MINKVDKKLLKANLLLIINQRLVFLNHNKFLKSVYEFEFQNVLSNLYQHEVNVTHNKYVSELVMLLLQLNIMEYFVKY